MAIEILNKVFFVLYFLSILNIGRTSFFIIGAILKSNTENPLKVRMSRTELLLLGLSIAYIISTFFTGIKITI